MPRVSFIIPVLNEAPGIVSLLTKLQAQYPDAERVLVDGGSSDGTAALAAPYCHHLVRSAPGRALQMNAGARQAAGDYLLFLHADCEPGIDAGTLDNQLASAPQWGFCPVRLSGDELSYRVIGWFMNQRSRLTAVATGDQMLFVARQTFFRLGGFTEQPLMEDVEICKRLRREARPLVLPVPVAVSSRRWREHGVLRTVFTMWALRLAYVCGVAPERLHRSYYGSG